jgi:hypothetical protein
MKIFFNYGSHEFVGDPQVELWKWLMDFESKLVSLRDVETLCVV